MKRGGFLKRTTPLRPKSTKQPKKEYAMCEFPRPSQIKKEPEIEHVYRDGRTKLNQNTKAGRDEYQRRKRVAWEAQGRLCSICKLRLNWADATVDHKSPRGMGAGSIDDRQENIAAAHATCNCEKGSKRICEFDEVIP